MNQIEATPEYRAYKAETELRKNVDSFSTALLYMHKINWNSKELVLFLGKDGDRNNAEALKTWVRKNLCCASCMREKQLNMLYLKLEKELNTLSDNYF